MLPSKTLTCTAQSSYQTELQVIFVSEGDQDRRDAGARLAKLRHSLFVGEVGAVLPQPTTLVQVFRNRSGKRRAPCVRVGSENAERGFFQKRHFFLRCEILSGLVIVGSGFFVNVILSASGQPAQKNGESGLGTLPVRVM